MTEQATSEVPACGLEETTSESARVPPTGPSGDTAAPQAPGGKQAPGGERASEPQESAPQPPDPAAPTATDPALPREGDESWGGRRGEAVMAGSGGGRGLGCKPLHHPHPPLFPQMSPVPRCCWPWRM